MMKFINNMDEQSRFALLFQITNGECKIETDNDSYFMAQTKLGYPVWVWTKNNISKNKIKEVQDKMKHFIIDNEKVKNINGADFKPKMIKDYPWCYVIFDNRKGIQRMLISRNKKAWERTDIPARIFYRTFDKLMLKEGMHFNPGDRPVYPKHEFWDVVKMAHQGVNRVLFKFPPTNLGRLLNLADNIDAIRQETGAGINVDMIAPKGGVVNLQQNMTQTDAMVSLGAAAGYEIKVWPKGINTPQTVGQQSVGAEISERVLNRLGENILFGEEIIDRLIVELNQIKTLYT